MESQIHDAGDHYTPAPKWVPFRRFFGYWACVIIGRWIGGLLGYKPFFKEYTTDWDFAVAKMKGNWWTRRNVEESYKLKTPWDKQVTLSAGPKPTNAEYEELVTDMTETWRKKQRGEVNGAEGLKIEERRDSGTQANAYVNGKMTARRVA